MRLKDLVNGKGGGEAREIMKQVNIKKWDTKLFEYVDVKIL